RLACWLVLADLDAATRSNGVAPFRVSLVLLALEQPLHVCDVVSILELVVFFYLVPKNFSSDFFFGRAPRVPTRANVAVAFSPRSSKRVQCESGSRLPRGLVMFHASDAALQRLRSRQTLTMQMLRRRTTDLMAQPSSRTDAP